MIHKTFGFAAFGFVASTRSDKYAAEFCQLLTSFSFSSLPGLMTLWILQAQVVSTLDSAIHRLNHYPANKYKGSPLRYPLDSDLSGG